MADVCFNSGVRSYAAESLPGPIFFLFRVWRTYAYCYVVSLQGKRGSDSDREYDAGKSFYIYY